MTELRIWAPDGVPEVRAGDDLAGLVVDSCGLADGDVLVVTSKVVSKAEGQVRYGDREGALAEETVRVVARRGQTVIVRNRLGLTLAAAGIDASNVELGSIVLLPADPDASARALRSALLDRTGHNVGVVVTDTAGRAWREGQTDIAIGAAGIVVAESFAGQVDGYGNPLAVTVPAVADELASAAELVKGKLGGRPFAVVRGRADLVLAVGDDGEGAGSLIREDGADLFGYGAREAVIRALRGDPADRMPFGSAVPAEELVQALTWVLGHPAYLKDGMVIVEPGPTAPPGADAAVARAVAFAHGWAPVDDQFDSETLVRLGFSPVTP
jgi:coenzyme F420-0:L-glutamate ligase/coenzyme F420-1:gamma-L-glutamate ligase